MYAVSVWPMCRGVAQVLQVGKPLANFYLMWAICNGCTNTTVWRQMENSGGTPTDAPIARANTSINRARAACVRCKARKTKCTGERPCRRCQLEGLECEYRRKRKRILVYDTEVEAYVERIRELEAALEQQPMPLAAAPQPVTAAVDLSVFLGSGSCELVCWNLKRLINNRARASGVPGAERDKIFVSPDFNAFIEETAYDLFLEDTLEPSLEPLKALTLEDVEALLHNVVLFINSGYLTLDPIEFKLKLCSVFDASGHFDVARLMRNSGVLYAPDYFFFIKAVMICALGEVYSPYSSVLGHGSEPRSANVDRTPGLDYFRVVVHYFPSLFHTLNSSKTNLATHLDIVELLGLISLYLRILDKKNMAVIFTMNALQICISLNLHKRASPLRDEDEESKAHHRKDEVRIFWSTFCLNRFHCSRIGKSLLLRGNEITTPYPAVAATDTMRSPSLDEFSSADFMSHYISLAKVADRITNEIYCVTPQSNSTTYLNSIFAIVHALVDWASCLPEALALKLPLQPGNPSNRLIYTLHLNYLHHVYLTCIPILLNLTKLHIVSIFNKSAKESIPTNINNVITISVQSAQLTINLFVALYKENLVRTFGFTDLDYLFSSALVFTMCLILGTPNNTEQSYSHEEYLSVSINLIGEMTLKGNLVARGKLLQIKDLVALLKSSIGTSHQYDSIFEFVMTFLPQLNGNITQHETPLAVNGLRNPMPEFTAAKPKQPEIDPHKRDAFGTLESSIFNDFELGRDFVGFSAMSDIAKGTDWNFPKITSEDLEFMQMILQDY
jgi:proline utilization trans-activator